VTGQVLVGKVGVVTTAVRGGPKPGEVRVVIEGLPHYYIAFCTHALTAGDQILVVNARGHRQIDVEPWDDDKFDVKDLAANGEGP
jgi:membrane protein implicated in regulation of membrane protease activity